MFKPVPWSRLEKKWKKKKNFSFICSRGTCKCGFLASRKACTIFQDSKKEGINLFDILEKETKKENFEDLKHNGKLLIPKEEFKVTNGSVVLNKKFVEFAVSFHE